MSIDSILATQSGVISREQALACGLSRDAIDDRVRGRRWRPLHPCVYLAAGHRHDDEVAVRSAVLWAGDGAVLCGLGAAWWTGMVERRPPVVTVTVGRARRPRGRPGVEVRRRDLDPADRTHRRGVAVTAPPLTAIEAAVELGDAGGALLDRTLRRGVPFPAVYAAHRRNLGTAGSAAAGRMLVAAADRAASVAERELVALLRRSGAAGWACRYPIGTDQVDIAFPAARVAIEVEGWAWHLDADRAQLDRHRNALLRGGWTVLRYTWHDLTSRPRAVLAEISHAVGQGLARAGIVGSIGGGGRAGG